MSIWFAGIVICVYRKYRRRTANTLPSALAGKVIVEKGYRSHPVEHVDLTDISIYTEKPKKAVLTPRSFDEPAGWVPQIKSYPQNNLPRPEPTASPKNKKSPKLSVMTADTPQSSPPNYRMANRASLEAQPPHPIPPLQCILTPFVPPLTSSANRPTKTIVSLAEEPTQLPTPRSESFTPQDLICPKEPSSPNPDEPAQRLPRLMTVAASFTPSLDDELSIKIGDIVRMLEEFRDGWCLIQRVGRIDAPKGVVPRFCLQERRGVAPIVPSAKYSTSSLSATREIISQ